MAKLNGPALAAVAVGSIFVYAGIKGYSPLKAALNIIQGKSGNEGQTTALFTSDTGGGGNGSGGEAGAPGGSRSKNMAIAKRPTKRYGWDSGSQWNALVSLWDSESGWSNTIWNTSASCAPGAYAYGIPQACSHGEHKSTGHGRTIGPFPPGNAGNPPEYGGTSNAEAQIAWGLSYIKSTYPGGPVNVPHGGY